MDTIEGNKELANIIKTSKRSEVKKLLRVLMIVGSIFAVLFIVGAPSAAAAVNLSALWDLIDEIVANMDSIVNLVIIGVVVVAANAIGYFVTDVLSMKGVRRRR